VLERFDAPVRAAAAAAAELDALASLALAAREYGYVRPAMVAAPVLHIEQGACAFCVSVLLRFCVCARSALDATPHFNTPFLSTPTNNNHVS
jgi:hypothetical protein